VAAHRAAIDVVAGAERPRTALAGLFSMTIQMTWS
jgi:hypothetical protein